MPVPSVSSSASAAPLAAPARASASSAQFASLSTTTGRSSRSLHQVAERARRERQVNALERHRAVAVHQRGDPEAHCLGLRRRRASASSTTSTNRSSTSWRSVPRHSRWSAVVHGELRRPRRRPAASCLPRRCPTTRLWAMTGRYTPRMAERPPDKPRVQGLSLAARPLRPARRARATRSPSCARRLGAGRSASATTEQRAAQSAAGPRAAVASRVLKWVAIAVGAWLLLSFVLFMVSAQIQDGVLRGDRAGARRAAAACSPASTILVLGSDQRAEDTLEPGAAGAARARRQHPADARRPRLGAEALGPARHAGRHPGSRHAEDQRGVRVRRRAADDRDGRGVPRQRPRDQPHRRGRLRGLPRVHRRPRRDRRRSSTNCIQIELVRTASACACRRASTTSTGRTRSPSRACARTSATWPRTTAPGPRRQQQVMSAIRDQILSPSTFFRLPLVSWEAPQTLSDRPQGPGLLGALRRPR